jgi:hypothetical protein
MGELPTPKAPELLGRAAALLAERGRDYDHHEGERSVSKTVDVFNVITGGRMTKTEGWLFMICLKQVRAFTTYPHHEDSLHDLIAYAALMAEEALS